MRKEKTFDIELRPALVQHLLSRYKKHVKEGFKIRERSELQCLSNLHLSRKNGTVFGDLVIHLKKNIYTGSYQFMGPTVVSFKVV